MTKKLLFYALLLTIAVAGCSKNSDVTPKANTEDADLAALNFANDPPKLCINKFIRPNASGLTTNGVVLKDKYWPIGKVIRIKFLNGSTFLQNKVIEYASKWSQYGNITFVKSTSASAELRVAFKFEGDEGSWSYIGTDSQHPSIDKTTPTMNFGWLTATTDETEFSRVIVHEVGHAIGLGHEQSSPVSAIKWNKRNVYYYFTGPPNNWTRDQVDYNIFFQYTKEETYYSPFDPKSIMEYAVDPRLTLDNKGIPDNTKLSAIDKIVVSKLYPR